MTKTDRRRRAGGCAAWTIDVVTPEHVVRPESIEDLSTTLRDLHSGGFAAIPWGGGTRMHIGNPPERYDTALDLTGLSRLLEHQPGDLTAVVEAGVTLSTLQAQLAGAGQRLTFDPPWPEAATIGGSLASNAVGPLRTGFGGVRDLVIGMRVVEPDGTVVKSGGRVVKNVQGYDLHRLHIGALGTLGVIAEVAFKLAPLPIETRTVAAWFESLDAIEQTAMQIFNGPFVPEALAAYLGDTASGLIADLCVPGVSAATPYLLMVRLAGGRQTVARQVDSVTGAAGAAMAAGFEVLDGASAEPMWKKLAEPEDVPVATVRMTVKPARSFGCLARLQKMTAGSGFDLSAANYAGFGTVIADWTPSGSAAGRDTIEVGGLLEACFELASAEGGGAMIERCPTEIKRTTDVFGDLGRAISIMRRMKHEFDPRRILSPGRYAAGI